MLPAETTMSYDVWNPTSNRIFSLSKSFHFPWSRSRLFWEMWACYALWSAIWCLIDTSPPLPQENASVTGLDIPRSLTRKRQKGWSRLWMYFFRHVWLFFFLFFFSLKASLGHFQLSSFWMTGIPPLWMRIYALKFAHKAEFLPNIVMAALVPGTFEHE